VDHDILDAGFLGCLGQRDQVILMTMDASIGE
jgi:hypothetical protein